ncbi:MAG: flavodoxin family protein [Chloroflexi bacterium]|nr:flavodoxin family protein [Chloroflexota bacterium]MCL5074421.1 flavodoxin family protein [Chloroflexota bacterium]
MTTVIKILGIAGSPRKGATEYAVQEALRAAAEVPGIVTEFYTVRGKKIAYCNHCDHCRRHRTTCIIRDDMDEVYELVAEADGFIIGSPVYNMNTTAQLQALLNRTRAARFIYPGAWKNKVGGAIAVGGTRHGGQETALLTILNFYYARQVIAVGGAFGGYAGGTIWSRDNRKTGAQEDEVGMATVLGLGRRVAEIARIVKLGKLSVEELQSQLGEPLPLEQQPVVEDYNV